MLSIKRLSYILILVLAVSVVFMTYNINEEKSKNINISNEPVEELIMQEPLQVEDLKQKYGPSCTYYIFGDSQKEIYKDIFRNVKKQMEDWKLSYVVSDTLFSTKNLEKNAVIIFCDELISEYVDLKELGDYISSGGRVIFAAGLPEGDSDSYLNPYWGITEKAGRDNYNQWELQGGIFPLEYEFLEYDGYSLSSRIAVRKDANVYIKGNGSGVPLVYTYDYNEGISCIINGTFLADANCTGFLAGAIGILQEDFIYPVLGVRCVFLDNFPMITYVNDKACMKLYGRNTESFVRDVVWPVLQGVSLRNQILYTSSVLTVASEPDAFPEINNSLFSTIGKSALQFEGELAYAVNTMKPEQIYLNRTFIEDFQAVFKNYVISGIAMMSEDMNYDVIQKFDNQIHAIRGRLDSENEQLRMSWEENTYTFPGATYGNHMENGNLAEILSVLTAYGAISHAFDINVMIAENDEVASWDTYKKQVEIFETQVLEPTDYLESKTLSQLTNHMKSYENLEFYWRKDKNQIFLYSGSFVEGQTFFYHTKEKIVKAEGLEYLEIGNGYYLLKIKDAEAMMELEEKLK